MAAARTRKTRTYSGWQKVGTICVDAGLCWIGDPCNGIDESWDHAEDLVTQFNCRCGSCGSKSQSVLVTTGSGDGFYDVEGKFAHGRVKEVRIKFF
jgi:hypothetical protein